jgi:hypothetical protein
LVSAWCDDIAGRRRGPSSLERKNQKLKKEYVCPTCVADVWQGLGEEGFWSKGWEGLGEENFWFPYFCGADLSKIETPQQRSQIDGFLARL